jgi:serine/threonine-protein kinase
MAREREPDDPPSVLDRIRRLAGKAPELRLPETPPAGGAPGTERPSRLGGYELGEEIARGGMGIVLRGRDVNLGRSVAVKVLREDLARDPSVVYRFVEEAQIAGQLQHPGIVPIYELGWTPDERPFFAMKLVRGDTLAELFERRGDPHRERRRLIEVFLAVCRAVAYAHSRGVVHRDLKPSNVMVGAFGEVQVLDWGLAKVRRPREPAWEPASEPASAAGTAWLHTVRTGPEASSLSQAGAILGTPRYMAPEQARGDVESIDERSDVFSLGAILCELLTGQPPFEKVSGGSLLAGVEAGIAQGLRRLSASDAEEDLVALARDCLAPDPAGRPADAGVVAERVGAHLDGLEQLARELAIEAARARVKAAEARRARRLRASLAATVVLAVALGALGWGIAERRERQRVERSSALARASAQETLALVERARAADAADLAAWNAAHAALAEAEAVVRGASVDDATREEIERLGPILAQGRAAAEQAAVARERDRRMLALLVEAALPPGDGLSSGDEHELRIQALDAAFRQYGVDVLGGDAVTRELADSAIALDLALALDGWIYADLLGGTGRAEHLLALASALDPDPARCELRARLVRGGNTADGIEELARRLLDQDAPPSTLVLAAVVQRRAGDAQGSLATLRAAAARHPGDLAIQLDLARVLSTPGAGPVPEALEHYRAALALRPDSISVTRGLGRFLCELGRPDEGVEILAGAVLRWPEHARLRSDLGTALSRAGREDEARRCFEEALALDPDLPVANLNLALALEAEGDDQRVIALLERAAAGDPDVHRIWSQLGQAYVKTDAREQALDALTRAIELAPDDAQAINNRGYVLRLLGRPAEALRDFERAVVLDPTYVRAWGHLTSLRRARGELDAASAALEHLRALMPVDHYDQNGLAWALATWPDAALRDPARAVALAEAAVAAEPAQGAYWNTLGVARYRAGDFDGAIEALEASMEHRDGGDPNDWLFLCMAEHARGRTESAREWFERSLEWRATHGEPSQDLQRWMSEARELLGESQD